MNYFFAFKFCKLNNSQISKLIKRKQEKVVQRNRKRYKNKMHHQLMLPNKFNNKNLEK